MSEWISVKTRLPEEDSLVVAAQLYDYNTPDACICNFYDGVFVLNEDGLEASNYDGDAQIAMTFAPTHWILLPDPIKVK